MRCLFVLCGNGVILDTHLSGMGVVAGRDYRVIYGCLSAQA